MGCLGSSRNSPTRRRRPRAPPILPSRPAAAAAPLHLRRLRTPTNCNFAELEGLSPPASPSAPPSSTSITPSPAAFRSIDRDPRARACKAVRSESGTGQYSGLGACCAATSDAQGWRPARAARSAGCLARLLAAPPTRRDLAGRGLCHRPCRGFRRQAAVCWRIGASKAARTTAFLTAADTESPRLRRL